jgi:hypothetical protein
MRFMGFPLQTLSAHNAATISVASHVRDAKEYREEITTHRVRGGTFVKNAKNQLILKFQLNAKAVLTRVYRGKRV